MDPRKWDKNFVYRSPDNPFHPEGTYDGMEMFVMDANAVPGAFRLMCAWFAGPWKEDQTPKPHIHNNDEIIMFLGSDYSKLRSLGGEIEFWFEDDKYLITESCSIYIPKFVQHAPMRPTRIDDPSKPMLFVGTVPTDNKADDLMIYNRDAKWAAYQSPPVGFPGVHWLDEIDLETMKAKY
jgi:hypothetical protein